MHFSTNRATTVNHTSCGRCVGRVISGVGDCVCLSVCLFTVHGSRSACIDSEVKSQWSRSRGYQMLGYAGRYDCLGFQFFRTFETYSVFEQKYEFRISSGITGLKLTKFLSDVAKSSIVVYLYLLFFITVMLPCCDGEIKLYIKSSPRNLCKTALLSSNPLWNAEDGVR